jgi:iron(III) transport system permease protein
VLLTVQSALRGLDPRSRRPAGRSARAGRTFLRVTLPQLRPSRRRRAAGDLYVLSDFGAVSILRYSTFTRALYLQYRSAFDRRRRRCSGCCWSR